jgi:Ca2+-binding EF-hand superfamily protein
VVTLQQLLNIKSRSLAEYQRVFNEIDQDGSGFIEVGGMWVWGALS